METKYLKINPADNVAVAVSDLLAGETISVNGLDIKLNEDIPAGHKFALKDFEVDNHIIKYGYAIGHAICSIKQGDWVNEKKIKISKRLQK